VLVVSAVIVTAIPVAYSLYVPELDYRALPVRLLVGALWLLAVVIGTTGGIPQSSYIDDLFRSRRRERSEMREESAMRILRLLLKPPGELGEYQWRLFVPDPYKPDTLSVPIYAPDHSTTIWPFGVGVTGTAYATGEPVCAVGEEIEQLYPVPDSLIDADRAARHAELKVVASMPLTSARGRTIGVLTASTNDELDHITTPQGAEEHSRIADAVTRVLIDMLGHPE
jgi:hypothetical protein